MCSHCFHNDDADGDGNDDVVAMVTNSRMKPLGSVANGSREDLIQSSSSIASGSKSVLLLLFFLFFILYSLFLLFFIFKLFCIFITIIGLLLWLLLLLWVILEIIVSIAVT